jgi:hypothetical protein
LAAFLNAFAPPVKALTSGFRRRSGPEYSFGLLRSQKQRTLQKPSCTGILERRFLSSSGCKAFLARYGQRERRLQPLPGHWRATEEKGRSRALTSDQPLSRSSKNCRILNIEESKIWLSPSSHRSTEERDTPSSRESRVLPQGDRLEKFRKRVKISTFSRSRRSLALVLIFI